MMVWPMYLDTDPALGPLDALSYQIHPKLGSPQQCPRIGETIQNPCHNVAAVSFPTHANQKVKCESGAAEGRPGEISPETKCSRVGL